MKLWPWRLVIPNRDFNHVYLTRWMLVPKNRWFNVYLHRFSMPDDTRLGLHDHPFDFLAVTLWGRGREVTPGFGDLSFNSRVYRPLKRFRFYRAEDIHAIVDVENLWTLVIHFRRRRKWGFWKDGKFTPHTEAFGQ